MREAILNGAADLGAVRPRKSQSKRKPAARGPMLGILNLVRARALRVVVWSGFAIMMGCIVLNATVFQKGRHPAPLFGALPPSGVDPSRQVSASAKPDSAAARPVEAPAPTPTQTAALEPAGQGGPQNDGVARVSAPPVKTLAGAHRSDPGVGDPKRTHTAVRVRPGQPHLRITKSEPTPQVRTAERARLTAMIAAATKPRGAMPSVGTTTN